MTPAELAIHNAIGVVEEAGCDVRLTNAVVLLGEAKDYVADFVDGVPEKPLEVYRLRAEESRLIVRLQEEREASRKLAEMLERANRDLANAQRDLLLTGHKCQPMAEMRMEPPRRWWLGRLTEPIAAYPDETHCLHIKSPLKEIVLGLQEADFVQFVAICEIALGYRINPTWLDNTIPYMKQRGEAIAAERKVDAIHPA